MDVLVGIIGLIMIGVVATWPVWVGVFVFWLCCRMVGTQVRKSRGQ
mgnify:CR=1 FL=1